MIRYTRIFITFLLIALAFKASAQSAQTISTTSNPYSMFGLGELNPLVLPQNIGMGGITTAINRISGYNNINPSNPASDAIINYTTIDVGFYSNISTFSIAPNGGPVQSSGTNTNFKLSHALFAIPITNRSAVSFGIMPYSQMGYNNIKTLSRGFGTSSPADTNVVNYISSGNGGISKAYIGYGYAITKHLYIGANVAYLFGDLQQLTSTELPNLFGTLNTRTELDNSIGGFSYDYGAQYSIDFGDNKDRHIVLAYSGSANSQLNTKSNYVVAQYTYATDGSENLPVDSLVNQQNAPGKVQLPQINHFGVSYQYDQHFLVGADYTMGHWSALSINGVNQGFQNSQTINVGGQFTPDANSLHSVWARTDYRLGFIDDQSSVTQNGTNYNTGTRALTFGMGVPLAPNLNTFYKINFAVEVGQEGTLANNSIKYNFINIHLGFTFNDKWFQRFKFD